MSDLGEALAAAAAIHPELLTRLTRIAELRREADALEEAIVRDALALSGWQVKPAARALGWKRGRLTHLLGLDGQAGRLGELGREVRRRARQDGRTPGAAGSE